MFLNDGELYAGVTSLKGVAIFNAIPSIETGYTLKRITDGVIVGNKVRLKNPKEINMYLEVQISDACIKNLPLEKNGIIYAGLDSIESISLFDSMESPYTGKKFVRIHDGVEFGNKIQLGDDYSYNGTIDGVRKDARYYYVQMEDE
ncbi:MAG: hypothetical protein ACRCZ9_10190 [Fusobacteriaceae bacterium]